MSLGLTLNFTFSPFKLCLIYRRRKNGLNGIKPCSPLPAMPLPLQAALVYGMALEDVRRETKQANRRRGQGHGGDRGRGRGHADNPRPHSSVPSGFAQLPQAQTGLVLQAKLAQQASLAASDLVQGQPGGLVAVGSDGQRVFSSIAMMTQQPQPAAAQQGGQGRGGGAQAQVARKQGGRRQRATAGSREGGQGGNAPLRAPLYADVCQGPVAAAQGQSSDRLLTAQALAATLGGLSLGGSSRPV